MGPKPPPRHVPQGRSAPQHPTIMHPCFIIEVRARCQYLPINLFPPRHDSWAVLEFRERVNSDGCALQEARSVKLDKVRFEGDGIGVVGHPKFAWGWGRWYNTMPGCGVGIVVVAAGVVA
jgi:hypothetical protein